MTTRELAYRHQDGLEVALRWNEESNEVSIEVIDERAETRLAFAVDRVSALDAFDHPFASHPASAPTSRTCRSWRA
jgi:hypothetical protein